MEIYLVIIFIMIALGIGAGIMWVVNNNILKSRSQEIIREAETKAEILKKDKLLEAKERFLQLKAEHEKEITTRNQQILKEENKIKQQEQSIKQKLENAQRKDAELDSIKQSLQKQLEAAVFTQLKEILLKLKRPRLEGK